MKVKDTRQARDDSTRKYVHVSVSREEMKGLQCGFTKSAR